MSALLPTSNSAEWHLSLACTLECAACSRGSFLREPHTEPMTIEDAHEFCRQARELGWIPGIVITGGEPTMHPDFLEMVRIATEFTRSGVTTRAMAPSESRSVNHVRVFSNAYTEKSRRLMEEAHERYGASIVSDTWKRDGSVTGPAMYPGWGLDTFVSPHDLGKPLRLPCYQHASGVCGLSVDHDGYSPCSIGGALDALLHVGGRTKVLADLFDPVKMAAMTEALCRHCGSCAVQTTVLSQAEVDAQPRLFNTPMSPTWVAAFEGRK